MASAMERLQALKAMPLCDTLQKILTDYPKAKDEALEDHPCRFLFATTPTKLWK